MCATCKVTKKSASPVNNFSLQPWVFLLPGSIGGESLAVAQNTYAVNWFKGKELNLVFGLQLSMARLVRGKKSLYNLDV